jgi:hypothetical protein
MLGFLIFCSCVRESIAWSEQEVWDGDLVVTFLGKDDFTLIENLDFEKSLTFKILSFFVS